MAEQKIKIKREGQLTKIFIDDVELQDVSDLKATVTQEITEITLTILKTEDFELEI